MNVKRIIDILKLILHNEMQSQTSLWTGNGGGKKSALCPLALPVYILHSPFANFASWKIILMYQTARANQQAHMKH